MSTNRWGRFLGILIWKKWATSTFSEKRSFLHPSTYVNIQPAPRFIPAHKDRRPVWKWQQRKKWIHWSRDYKIIFPPPQMSSSTDNCFLLCLLHKNSSHTNYFPKQIKTQSPRMPVEKTRNPKELQSHSILQNNSGFVNLNYGINIFNTQRVFVFHPLTMGKGSVLSHHNAAEL